MAKSVSSPISVPRFFGLFIKDNLSNRRQFFIFLVFLFNAISQITNIIIFCRAPNISSRIERVTYFIEAGVAAVLYAWLVRVDRQISKTVIVRLNLFESLLLFVPLAWMIIISVRFLMAYVKTPSHIVVAAMYCLGRSFGCALPIYMATLCVFRLTDRWAAQINGYSNCVRMKHCQCGLASSKITTLDSIQRHISAER